MSTVTVTCDRGRVQAALKAAPPSSLSNFKLKLTDWGEG